MNKSILLLLITSFFIASCGSDFETSDAGIKYRVLSHDDNERKIEAGEMLLVNLKMTGEKSDSLLLETFKDNTPRYIPSDEPVLKSVFAMLSKNDSVEIIVNADTLFQKSFGVEKPESMKNEENVKFIIKIVDIFSKSELKEKSQEQVGQLSAKDSVSLSNYVATLKDVKTTPSGLMYIVEKEGTGKQAAKGDKVSMKYRGYFVNGETFDENLNREPLDFVLGLGQVIPGWEEGVSLMKEGAKYKLIIPWQLAYGERGSGPILPCTSLIFDVELLKISKEK